MNEAYLCLGGNIGNCIARIEQARQFITEKAGKIRQKSGIYRTAAWGMDKAPDFYNQVLLLETPLPARELMQVLLDIEKSMGRHRGEQQGYQNRVMDIDILFFNEDRMEEEGLHIPHPRLHLRNFVLAPLHELAPGLMHPLLGKSVQSLLETCPDKNPVSRLEYA